MTGKVQHLGFVDRNRAALDLVRHPGKVAVIVVQVGDLGGGLSQDLAVVSALKQRQFGCMLLDQRSQVEDQPRALGLSDVTPTRRFQRTLRSGNRLIDLCWGAISDVIPLLACRGLSTWPLRPRACIKPLSINKDG